MRRNQTILVVEDDATTAELIRLYLEHEGFSISVATDGPEGLERAVRDRPSLIVLDVMLPHMDGFELCRRLRAESDAPVIMLTARSTEGDKVAGLDSGADDYLAKPFSPRELVARVHAVLRRGGEAGPARRRRFEFNGLTLDVGAHEATVDGHVVSLTPAEFSLLETLCRAPDAAFSRSQLVERAFGFDYEGAERTVDAHVAKLRKKIRRRNGKPEFITTVFGVGYKFAGRRAGA